MIIIRESIFIIKSRLLSISYSLEKQNTDNGYPVCKVNTYVYFTIRILHIHYDMNKAQKRGRTVILHSTVKRLLYTYFVCNFHLSSSDIYTTITSKTDIVHYLTQLANIYIRLQRLCRTDSYLL